MEAEYIGIKFTLDESGQWLVDFKYDIREVPPYVIEQVLRDMADDWRHAWEEEEYLEARKN